MNAPSNRRSGSDQTTTRRRLLAAVGAGMTATLAGCGTVLQDGPRSLNPPAVIDERPTSRVWEFPRGASDRNTPVQAHLEQEYPVSKTASPLAARFSFGATVFDHSKYQHDQIKLRLQADREGTHPPANIFVHPLAGRFKSFRSYVDDLETIIVLSDLEETGTLQFGFLVGSRTRPHPEMLEYRFEITATNEGLLNQTAIASDSGRFPIAYGDD